jgi:hypothetical protein
MANDSINFYYDPTRQGLDTTLWKILSGTPSYAGGKITLNAAEMIGYADILKGEITLSVTIPTAPTADLRKWGLFQKANGAGVWFDILADVFSCNVKNQNGTTESAIVEWQTAWTAKAEWTIKWTGFSAEFLVNGVQIAFLNGDTLTEKYSTSSVPTTPLSIYLRNDNSDNMDLSYVEALNVQGYV